MVSVLTSERKQKTVHVLTAIMLAAASVAVLAWNFFFGLGGGTAPWRALCASL